MTVHSPQARVLGQGEVMTTWDWTFLEVIKSLGRFWWFTAPQARVLGQGEVFELLNALFIVCMCLWALSSELGETP
jgi:hypothetical protein